MEIKLNTIVIENVIVHSIPKHIKGDLSIEPKYSKQESKLSDGLKLFLKDKIVQALGSDKSFKICFTEPALTVSKLRDDVLNNRGDFVEHSKELANHLFKVQVGQNAAGILVFVLGTVNSKNTCFIIKLEMDTGMQLTLDTKTDSFDITEVKDLMLTKKTKIFKVAMLILREDFSSDYDGRLMDYQIDLKGKKDVITWFIDRFLGCVAYEDPKITTQRFYHLTRAFIDTIDEPIDQAKFLQDLNSYVQKNSNTLSPKEFAEDYLGTPEQMTNYKNYLISQKFNFTAFTKDTSQIERQVKKIMITFDNDISIIGNKGVLDDKVKLEKLDNGQTKAEIISRIRKIA